MSDKPNEDTKIKKATFGMGCFWTSDAVFGCTEGVTQTRVGYCGGTGKNPTYKNIGDFIEAVEIDYDAEKLSFDNLLQIFWENHDSRKEIPRQHSSIIFYHTPHQLKLAEESLKARKENHQHVATKIFPATEFYVAEDYHQKHFLQQHPKIIFSLEIPQNTLHKSEVATKLNSYIAGYGNVDNFESEFENFGLTLEVESIIRNLIQKNQRNPGRLICNNGEESSSVPTVATLQL